MGKPLPPLDWGDVVARTDGAAEVDAGKRLPLIVSCATAVCPGKVAVPPGDPFRTERTLRRALLEHEGPIYKKQGGWTVQPMILERTLMEPVRGFAPFCPSCSRAIEARRRDSVVGQIAREVAGGGGKGST